jgi:hypothetical protein
MVVAKTTVVVCDDGGDNDGGGEDDGNGSGDDDDNGGGSSDGGADGGGGEVAANGGGGGGGGVDDLRLRGAILVLQDIHVAAVVHRLFHLARVPLESLVHKVVDNFLPLRVPGLELVHDFGLADVRLVPFVVFFLRHLLSKGRWHKQTHKKEKTVQDSQKRQTGFFFLF